MKISIKLRVFTDRLFVSRSRGVGYWGLTRREGGNSWVRDKSAVGGWGNSGGSTVGVSSTSKNRPKYKSPTRHKYKSPKQFEPALRALNARWSLPVSVFEDEKSKASDEKSVKRKFA